MIAGEFEPIVTFFLHFLSHGLSNFAQIIKSSKKALRAILSSNLMEKNEESKYSPNSQRLGCLRDNYSFYEIMNPVIT